MYLETNVYPVRIRNNVISLTCAFSSFLSERPPRSEPRDPRHWSDRVVDQKRGPRFQREETGQNRSNEQGLPTTAHQASRLRDIQDIRHLLLGLPSHLRFHLHAEDASRHLLVLLSKKGEEAGIVPVQRDATAKAYARQVHEGQGEEHGQNTPFGVRD